jgi:hypothetical protein
MQTEHQDHVDVPKAPSYPFYIESAEDRHRYDMCFAIAMEMMDAPPYSAAVLGAARVMFLSDLPT